MIARSRLSKLGPVQGRPTVPTRQGGRCMLTAWHRNLSCPGEVKGWPKEGRAELAYSGGDTVERSIFEPGWRWPGHALALSAATCVVSCYEAFKSVAKNTGYCRARARLKWLQAREHRLL